TVRSEGFEELDPHRALPEEGHAHPLRRHVLDGFRFKAQGPIVREGRLETPDRDPAMVGRADHTSCLGRYVPKTDRSTSLISPSVALARTASRIAGIVFASPRATASRRPRIRVTAFRSRLFRNPSRARARSAANFGFVLGTGIASPSSAYAFTPTTVLSPP